jgi:hypothetical protein
MTRGRRGVQVRPTTLENGRPGVACDGALTGRRGWCVAGSPERSLLGLRASDRPAGKPRSGAPPDRVEQWERDRHGHSSDGITVDHALADHKRWKQLTRWTHRRDRLPDTYRAIAGLVSDRTITA